jgi:hypothetical protein
MYYCFVIVKERVYNISKAQNRSSMSKVAVDVAATIKMTALRSKTKI